MPSKAILLLLASAGKEAVLRTSDFDYNLPQGLIAQEPLEDRDQSRLLVLKREGASITHRRFYELSDYLRAGDVLVMNDSRVIPARLFGRKEGGGGRLEILLLRRHDSGGWEALLRPAKRVKLGTKIAIDGVVEGKNSGVSAEVIQVREGGIGVLRFNDESLLAGVGRVALPPYIKTPLTEPQRYQTVYASSNGSVAAPTAGLHFTPQMLGKLEKAGIRCLYVSLHIGLDTFRPVREEDPRKHHIHREYGLVEPEVATELSRARREGRRIICVGTTTVRLLEHAAALSKRQPVDPFAGWVDIFILPGHRFRAVDGLITNFHLPRSTLLMMVYAFAGRESIKKAYEEAVREGYRFYSFGDAMLII
jgi:S-adenosylmethionine:tRNA ribosyltransferase-isomerase